MAKLGYVNERPQTSFLFSIFSSLFQTVIKQ